MINQQDAVVSKTLFSQMFQHAGPLLHDIVQMFFEGFLWHDPREDWGNNEVSILNGQLDLTILLQSQKLQNGLNEDQGLTVSHPAKLFDHQGPPSFNQS
ncbi:MAG TPA: hypothetical protein ENK02_06355 [Planctomycetes bacterium]|nr:hypothetical protein [Planctomycetota bacterium]